MQWIPFAHCGLGLPAAGAALVRPQRKILLALRVCMAVVALRGSNLLLAPALLALAAALALAATYDHPALEAKPRR
jgi:hypothetical protein